MWAWGLLRPWTRHFTALHGTSPHAALTRCDRSREEVEPLALGARAHDLVAPAHRAHAGRGLGGVAVAGEEHGVVGQLRQPLRQAEVHLARIAARQVGAAAA